MQDKLNYQEWLNRLKKFRDPRKLGLAVFVVIILLVTWSGVKAVEANYKLERQISALQQQNAVQKLKNQNLKLQNNYYNSDQYLKLSARQNLGLGEPGEKLLIVPRNVALSYTKDLPQQNQTKAASNEPFFVNNFKAWWSFFLGRQADSAQK